MHVFFDLDGTLTDSSPGMRNCYHHALRFLGRPLPSDERLRRCFGPPLAAAFKFLLDTSDTELIESAITAYRSRYSVTGLFENELYPDVLEGLQLLQGSGHRLRLVTAKPRPYAERIIQWCHIARYFDAIHAPTLEDRTRTKRDVLARAVEEIGDPRDLIVMVGDLTDDIHAARTCGVRSIAAAWGFGLEDELAAAAPDVIAQSMTDVVAWVHAQPEGLRK